MCCLKLLCCKHLMTVVMLLCDTCHIQWCRLQSSHELILWLSRYKVCDRTGSECQNHVACMLEQTANNWGFSPLILGNICQKIKWKIFFLKKTLSTSLLLQHCMFCWKQKVEQRSEAAKPLVTLWWLNAVCSYQQLLPCITCNYKWPWAADEEPIRFQLACQPKTNYLLALTAGFYLHNSNPSANCNPQAAVTHSLIWLSCLQAACMGSPAAFKRGELINRYVIKML